MGAYNDKLASGLPSYPQVPSDLNALSPEAINLNALGAIQKANLLRTLQQSYLTQGKALSPVEKYALGSVQALDQAGLPQ